MKHNILILILLLTGCTSTTMDPQEKTCREQAKQEYKQKVVSCDQILNAETMFSCVQAAEILLGAKLRVCTF